MSSHTPVIDYEGSHYQTDFWVNQGREYEDQTERLLIKRLLPPTGRRIVEIGAGFGRLADLYTGYDQIILFDYSRSLLEEAANQWGDDSRFVFVAGNVYELPFADCAIDTLVMVRVMHHLANVESALKQLARVTHSDSISIIEYANKRNLKSVLRWALRQQSWSPFAPEPYEFVELNFDFHPAWMKTMFDSAGLAIEQRLAISHFRLALLKRLLPPQFLAQIDNRISTLGGLYPLSPSVFVQAVNSSGNQQLAKQSSSDNLVSLFCCPNCGTDLANVGESSVTCSSCSASYHKKGRIWDFKERK